LDRGSQLQLKRFHVEELRRRLEALEGMRSGLGQNIRELETATARERQRNPDSAIARLALPRILEGIESRRKNLEKTLSDLEHDRTALEAELFGAIQELEAAENAEEERRRRSAWAATTAADYRQKEQFTRRHLRRHATR
jgi:flagellar protein FliJ